MYIGEQEFNVIVHKYTGKELGKDYGFVAGTHHPFGSSKGMLSASNKAGFMIWKKELSDTGEASYTEKWITPLEWTEPVKDTINFLNSTTFKIKLSKNQ